jgi:ATP-dependent DNA helicase RecG
MNISEMLIRPEGKTLEFKRDISSLKPILRTLAAFANTAGGILIIGRESDGTVHGVPEALQAEERLANAIADSIRPAMMPEIEIYSHNDKSLLILRVFHWKGPFYLKSDGPEKGVYVRLGSTNRQAGPEILAELQRSMQNRSFDQLPCHDLSIKALDIEKVQRAFTVTGQQIDEKKLESLGLLVPYAGDLSVSNGGLILFGLDDVRQRYFPDARVSCARFRGTDKSEFIDRIDIAGSVLNAIDEVPRFIRRNTRLAAKIENMHRQDIPEYPELAIREILVNAIGHADYSLRGMRILVGIYADRMEIQNPGMLPFGMTIEDLKAGVSKIRNRVIARSFREMGLMEEWGSGYKRVIHACQSGGYPEPDWEELGTAFRVIFHPHPAVLDHSRTSVPVSVPVNVPVNDRQRWFLEQLAAGKQIRASDLAVYWSISEKTAKRDIADLKRNGLIKFVGAPKNGFYRIMEEWRRGGKDRTG